MHLTGVPKGFQTQSEVPEQDLRAGGLHGEVGREWRRDGAPINLTARLQADPRQQTPGASKPTSSAMWFNIFISKPFQSSRGGTNLLNSQSGGL